MLKNLSEPLSWLRLYGDEQRSRPTQFTMRNLGEPTQALRVFEVSGEDDDGVIHSFHTDNCDQADDIAAIFREDLDNVEVHRHF